MDIERELERTIEKYRGREVATFETRIDLLAQDCLDEIRRLKKQISDAALAEPDADVAEAIEWMEIEKESAQNSWERAGAEWRMEPGAHEMHDEQMAAFDLAIQALCQMKPSEWIPVSERLPTEELASVLVYTKDGGVSEGQYYPTIKSWKQFRWSVENATVTHWMPLPNPPESEARATPVSGDSPIAVRCQACGCPVVLHRLFEDGVLAGEHIDCACGYVYGWGKEV